MSIEAQLTELREFAKQNNLFIVKEFYESKTAKEPGREVFNFMLSEIEKRQRFGNFSLESRQISEKFHRRRTSDLFG